MSCSRARSNVADSNDSEQQPVLILIVDEPTTPQRTSEEEELAAEKTMLSSLHRDSSSIAFMPIVSSAPPRISLNLQFDDEHRWSGRTSFPDLLKLNSKPLLD